MSRLFFRPYPPSLPFCPSTFGSLQQGVRAEPGEQEQNSACARACPLLSYAEKRLACSLHGNRRVARMFATHITGASDVVSSLGSL